LNLKPCPFRQVGEEGTILCDKIKTGDKEVSPNICRACPVSAINCAHLRATLDHQSRPPITVRYGNGKREVWNDIGDESISLERAACAEKVMPIHSPRDCAGCSLRKAVGSEQWAVNSQPTTERRRPPATPRVAPAPVAPQPIAQAVQPAPAATQRDTIVAQKIIQLQDWLKHHKTESEDSTPSVQPIAVGERRVARPSAEEKRVGWTD
jgi:hypothetical protein